MTSATDELEEMADGDDYYPPESIRKLADRIRKLAEKEASDADGAR